MMKSMKTLFIIWGCIIALFFILAPFLPDPLLRFHKDIPSYATCGICQAVKGTL